MWASVSFRGETMLLLGHTRHQVLPAVELRPRALPDHLIWTLGPTLNSLGLHHTVALVGKATLAGQVFIAWLVKRWFGVCISISEFTVACGWSSLWFKHACACWDWHLSNDFQIKLLLGLCLVCCLLCDYFEHLLWYSTYQPGRVSAWKSLWWVVIWRNYMGCDVEGLRKKDMGGSLLVQVSKLLSFSPLINFASPCQLSLMMLNLLILSFMVSLEHWDNLNLICWGLNYFDIFIGVWFL